MISTPSRELPSDNSLSAPLDSESELSVEELPEAGVARFITLVSREANPCSEVDEWHPSL